MAGSGGGWRRGLRAGDGLGFLDSYRAGQKIEPFIQAKDQNEVSAEKNDSTELVFPAGKNLDVVAEFQPGAKRDAEQIPQKDKRNRAHDAKDGAENGTPPP